MNLASAATGFALGMLTMHFFDGRSGRARRALVRDKALSQARRTAHRAGQQARYAAGQARGVAATGNLERSTRRAPEDDRQLHERVRARMGRAVSHPAAIEVQAEAGRIVLQGNILRAELDDLLHAVREVPGVVEVENRLTAHDHPDHIPDLQGSGRHESSQVHRRSETQGS